MDDIYELGPDNTWNRLRRQGRRSQHQAALPRSLCLHVEGDTPILVICPLCQLVME